MTLYKTPDKTYQIVIKDEEDRNTQREEQILKDFLYCERMGDFITIKNRISKGLKWGELIEIKIDG